MQPAEHRLRDDLARCLDSSHDRSVATERLMGPALVVVDLVLAHSSKQVPFVQAMFSSASCVRSFTAS